MNSFLTPDFWSGYSTLSKAEQAAARVAYARFLEDPGHPSLRFGKLTGHTDLWYVRVTRSIRVVGRREGDEITWFWIGSHASFDHAFS